MSLLGILFEGGGSSPSRPPPSPPPPSSPPPEGSGSHSPAASGAGTGPAGGAGSTGDSAPASGGGSTGATGNGTSASGNTQARAGSPPRAPRATGTPIAARATRPDFGTPDTETAVPEDQERAHALAMQRAWRLSSVLAAISGGPMATRLIEAANRPGPVEPGSLLEAVKMLRPAPTAPQSSRAV